MDQRPRLRIEQGDFVAALDIPAVLDAEDAVRRKPPFTNQPLQPVRDREADLNPALFGDNALEETGDSFVEPGGVLLHFLAHPEMGELVETCHLPVLQAAQDDMTAGGEIGIEAVGARNGPDLLPVRLGGEDEDEGFSGRPFELEVFLEHEPRPLEKAQDLNALLPIAGSDDFKVRTFHPHHLRLRLFFGSALEAEENQPKSDQECGSFPRMNRHGIGAILR